MNNLDDFVKVDEEYEDIDPNKIVICRCFLLHTKCLMKCVVFFTCEEFIYLWKYTSSSFLSQLLNKILLMPVFCLFL